MSLTTRIALKAMEKIAPLRLAEKWDNVGLLLESPVSRPNANRILLTIDLTPSVLSEALAYPSTTLIIAYHPPLFTPLSALTLSSPLPAALLKLAAAGVSVYSPHTALDSVWGGVNDWLVEGVRGASRGGGGGGGDDDVRILGESKGEEGGVGRVVVLEDAIAIEELVQRVKHHLGISHVDVARPMMQRLIRAIAICAGSGGSVLNGVDADVYFTGEMSHHQVLAAVAAGRYVVLCGHTNTERGYLPVLAQTLRSTLAEFEKHASAGGGSGSGSGSESESGAAEQAPPTTTPSFTKDEREALRRGHHVEVVVSLVDGDPLERM